VRNKDGFHRIKLYILSIRWKSWQEHLEITNPNSIFSINFSSWLRMVLSKIPNEISISSLNVSDNLDHKQKIKSVLEKTVWIPTDVYKSLMIKKKFLSLNSYIQILIEQFIFSQFSQKNQILNYIDLKRRVERLEDRRI